MRRGGKHLRKRRPSTPFLLLTIALTLAAGIAACSIGAETANSDQTKPAQQQEAPETPPQATEAPERQTPHPTKQPPAEATTAAEKEEIWLPDEAEVAYIAKTIFGEASVVPSKARQAAVGWCILNRVDSPIFPDTIAEVVTQPHQFHSYHANSEPPEEYFELARDILTHYHAEQQGETETGRTLPQGWCFFTGDGKENHFTEEWNSLDNWDWTLPDPYAQEGDNE